MRRKVIIKIGDKYYHSEIKVGLFNFKIVIIARTNNLEDVFGKRINFEVIYNKTYSLKSYIIFYMTLIANKFKLRKNKGGKNL